MTEDWRSHLLTQIINGKRILFVNTPSGNGISIYYPGALGYSKYFLNFILKLLNFAIFIKLWLFVSFIVFCD
jgi:hypothetical protein